MIVHTECLERLMSMLGKYEMREILVYQGSERACDKENIVFDHIYEALNGSKIIELEGLLVASEVKHAE